MKKIIRILVISIFALLCTSLKIGAKNTYCLIINDYEEPVNIGLFKKKQGFSFWRKYTGTLVPIKKAELAKGKLFVMEFDPKKSYIRFARKDAFTWSHEIDSTKVGQVNVISIFSKKNGKNYKIFYKGKNDKLLNVLKILDFSPQKYDTPYQVMEAILKIRSLDFRQYKLKQKTPKCVVSFIKKLKERLDKLLISKDAYRILGIPQDADFKQIRAAYLKLLLKWHPDKKAKIQDEYKLKMSPEDLKYLNDISAQLGEAFEELKKNKK